MNNSKLRCLFTCIIATIFLVAIPLQSQAATNNNKHKTAAAPKVKNVTQGALTWALMPETLRTQWDEANAYCTNTAINGQTGWRLPTKDEMIALHKSGAMKNQGWTLYYPWSSTPAGSVFHYGVDLVDGLVMSPNNTEDHYVTCVHEVPESVQTKQNQQAATPKGYVSQGGLTWMPASFINEWGDANAYCNNTAINGQTGWRLPTKDELVSLYNSGAMNNQGWTLNATWSSTLGSVGHYGVDLHYAGEPIGWIRLHYDTKELIYVTCVREEPESVQTKQNQKVAAPKNYVTQGGLTWMPVTFSKNWNDANDYCTNTAINGQTGWRLPTKAELSALYKSDAMSDQGWLLGETWSSTPVGSYNPDIHSSFIYYSFRMFNGMAIGSYDTSNYFVTCVR